MCDQQLVELKELYDAEQRLSAELGEKLGKTQVSFQSESCDFTILASMLLISSVLFFIVERSGGHQECSA
jgi:hypothetical protein